MSGASIKVHTAIVADQIRREDNGKAIIIGVYSGDIIPDRFPTNLVFAFWLEVEIRVPKRPFQMTMELRTRIRRLDENSTKPFETLQTVNLEFVKTGVKGLSSKRMLRKVLIVNGVPASITGPGTLEFSIREKGKRWKKVITKRIASQDAGDDAPSAESDNRVTH